MVDKEDFKRQVRRATLLTVGLAAALVFGIVLIVDGDWIPGGITVLATLTGLARQIPVIRRLCSEGPSASPPTSRPAS